MKKVFTLITVLVFMCGMLASFPITAVDEYENGVLTYTVSDTSVTIKDCDTTATNTQVASAFSNIESQGYTITTIGACAFEDCAYLTSIDLPDNLQTLGASAFRRTNLDSISIPQYLKTVGHVYSAPFAGSNLKSATIEDGMTVIPEYLFSDCGTLTNVTIPDSVTRIGSYAFDGCDNLTIYGYRNSYAETYANENSIPFVEIGTVTPTDPIEPPTLTEKTLTYYDEFERANKTASVYWGGELFSGDSRTIENENPAYYENLAKVGAILSKGAYDIPNNNEVFSTESLLQKNLEILGFTNIKTYNGGKISYPAHVFATQEITLNGEKQKLILIDIRGTDKKEIEDLWTDALVIATGEYPKKHPGFSDASSNILSELPTYLFDNGVNPANAKILITGHSYGAAVANLLSKSLEDMFAPEDIYGYTYASPNNIVVENSNNDISSATNIHNFRNTNDIITKIPGAPSTNEQYTIYGNKHNFTVQNYKGFLDDHDMTTYINY